MNLSSWIEEGEGPGADQRGARIVEHLKNAGFEQASHVELATPLTIGFYEEWLASGYHGEMDYLYRHLPLKASPERLFGKARSAFVVTKNYVPHPEPVDALSGLKIAAYARGRDYHHFLKGRLEAAMREIRELHPEEEFVCFTDSAPILERDLARRAGLGWIGKNTCLLSRDEGSYFFIAEIYSTLSTNAAGVSLESADHCGTCTKCLDACPTGALIEPRKLDARLCISYLTIESREVPPVELREKMGTWFFGCDICQSVCPWNIRLKRTPESRATRDDAIRDLRFIIEGSIRSLDRAFRGTAMARAEGLGLKRNAIITATNMRAVELSSSIAAYRDHGRLGELARWALTILEEQSRDQ